MGFMDSKQLTEAKRDSLWEALQTSERVHRVADSHPPRQIRDLRRHAQEAYQVLAAARRPGGCILKEDTLKYKMKKILCGPNLGTFVYIRPARDDFHPTWSDRL